MREEKRRSDLLNILLPPAFAVVPNADPEGIPLSSSGWMVCRSVSTKSTLQNAETFASENEFDVPDILLQFHGTYIGLEIPEGILALINPVEPETLKRGTLVICRSDSILKEYGCIVDVGIRNTYLTRLSSGKVKRFHRSRLQVLGSSVFFFNPENNISGWKLEDVLSGSHALNPPRLDGPSWEEVHSLGILRRYFTAFDEFFDGHSGKVYYVNFEAFERESAARVIQELVRQKLNFPVIKAHFNLVT